MPRARFLQKALRGAQPPQPVAIPKVQAKPVTKKQEYLAEKSDPSKFAQYSQKLLQNFETAVAENKPHFKIGGKEVYFPWAKVTLLRNSAKMTPYQAQFQVPRDFNKLDLRDYLWNLYGLRALNITTQIKWSEWTRSRISRYRTPQVKKMIIDMEEPFLWPEEDMETLKSHDSYNNMEFQKYEEEMQMRQGSDLKKPAKAFDGVLGPFPDAPQSYVPKLVQNRLQNSKKRAIIKGKKQSENELISQFLKL